MGDSGAIPRGHEENMQRNFPQMVTQAQGHRCSEMETPPPPPSPLLLLKLMTASEM